VTVAAAPSAAVRHRHLAVGRLQVQAKVKTAGESELLETQSLRFEQPILK
jgi:hypothetical protein